jgi:hypothetical protein
VGFDLLVGPHVLRQVAFEHFVADVAVEGLDVLVEAGDVLLEGVATVKRSTANMAHEVTLVEVTFEVDFEICQT